MTREEAITKYIVPAIEKTWNDKRCKEILEALEQEPKTGHWTRELIRNEKGGCIGAKMICSECGNDNKHDEYMNYCPNCGTRMSESRYYAELAKSFARGLRQGLSESEDEE